ncbi:MAG TPA: type II toxin-antitoxin system VapC family toxin [Acidobacteriaceae bacterium]|nr:type II toxin-antitoxin system VapC family toxin [Acidobacteriaceae bacterium]
MRVLVDTHTFIWALLHDHRLSARAKSILRGKENELAFSLVSLWEIAVKMKIGKLNSLGSSVSYIRDEMNAYGMEILPIRYEHILQLEMLPPHHGDPFDRLLISQAITESLPILTNDAKVREYSVKVLW